MTLEAERVAAVEERVRLVEEYLAPKQADSGALATLMLMSEDQLMSYADAAAKIAKGFCLTLAGFLLEMKQGLKKPEDER